MKLAVLFWFYKDVEVCINRLQLLRKYNPRIKIFGLYGGDLNKAAFFQEELFIYLDDFYCFTGSQDPGWKWVNGDLMINHWFRERGENLVWDSITIIQADMVAIGKISQIFKCLKPGEILLSSTRKVRDVEKWWYWIKERRSLYDDFLHYMKQELGYCQEPVCCQYVIVCLPRVFLKQYSLINNPELGFIEYRVPMYAQLFNVPFNMSKKFDCWWGDDPEMAKMPLTQRTLIADKIQIPLTVILWNLARKGGSRIFHPFDQFFPVNLQTAISYTNRALKGIKIGF